MDEWVATRRKGKSEDLTGAVKFVDKNRRQMSEIFTHCNREQLWLFYSILIPGKKISYVESITLRLHAVPEPSVIALIGLGFVGIGIMQRRRSRRDLCA